MKYYIDLGSSTIKTYECEKEVPNLIEEIVEVVKEVEIVMVIKINYKIKLLLLLHFYKLNNFFKYIHFQLFLKLLMRME